ncbi:MAG: DUF3775 domain-containing protein [Rhizobiaceae bacterium]|nr:DUF3775 domain-containing protein [Rhizobiaceae bacterium]
MRHKTDPEWALSISPETVRLFILKAKAISAGVNSDYDDGHEHEIEMDSDRTHDTHQHDGLVEEEQEDLTEEELRELIDDLNVDEAADLVALAWVGRGDYDAGEWAEAVAEAKRRGTSKTSKYLMGMPMLGAWLEEGLEALGA